MVNLFGSISIMMTSFKDKGQGTFFPFHVYIPLTMQLILSILMIIDMKQSSYLYKMIRPLTKLILLHLAIIYMFKSAFIGHF